MRGRKCSLVASLMMSASGCSEAERADAVGAVAVLEAAEQLALGEQHDRHDLQRDANRSRRLEDLDLPGLVVADLGEDRASLAAPTSTRAAVELRRGILCDVRPRGRRVPSGDRGAQRARRMRRASRWRRRARGRRGATPSRWASAGESSARWRGRRNFSAGETSTSGDAQIERNVPRRRRAVGRRRVRRRPSAERAGAPRPAMRRRVAAPASARRAPPISSSVSPA